MKMLGAIVGWSLENRPVVLVALASALAGCFMGCLVGEVCAVPAEERGAQQALPKVNRLNSLHDTSLGATF